ncbi:epidermal growth factor receptor kinase substrate 8-like protein 3 [Pholidichthys leucotaenia]
MFRSESAVSHDRSSYAGSIQSNSGLSILDEVLSQASDLSRPSAKEIYMQRKEYASSINKMMGKFQYRVEHLFTCELDGKELRDIKDCVEHLKLLEEMGRVWGQNMMLHVQGTSLLLTDIETQEELESMALRDVQKLQAVMDADVFNSLLTVSVQPRNKRTTTVFIFQCEDVRADYVQKDLSRALSRIRYHRINGSSEPEPPREEELFPPREGTRQSHPVRRPYTELDRNVDILNHILGDIELFIGQVSAVEAKNAKKKKKKWKKSKVLEGMPPAEDFAACLHKIKYAFNLLPEMNGKINNPSAADFVHTLFTTLAFVVSHGPAGLSPTIVAPLLTPHCIRFLSEEATTEEDQLWQTLGDPWNIPSTQWPEDDEDIPTYTLQFFDGWQPPEVSEEPAVSEPGSREASPSPSYSESPARWTPPPQQRQWTPPRSPQRPRSPPRSPQRPREAPPQSYFIPRPSEPKVVDMRVKSDFISRNHRELTVRRGEIVKLLDKSKQWWKVRNHRGEEGFVPNNVLEDLDEQSEDEEEEIGTIPVLTRRSKPAEVKAWLEDKGFSQITVRCLGGLGGSMLLGMSREELKTVCPEEGGRVFFQLQAVRSAMATAS